MPSALSFPALNGGACRAPWVIWSAIVYDSALMFQLCKYCRPAMMVSGAYNAVWACKKFR